MAVLIVGGAGYIGAHTCYEFLEQDTEVIVLDNLSTGHRAQVPPSAVFYEGDYGDTNLLGRILKRHKIDAVIHLAGATSVPESIADPLRYYQNNAVKSCCLLQQCQEYAVENFIFSSTAAVYGNCGTHPVTEETLLSPQSPYASSKIFVERMLQDCAQAYGMKALVLRYFNVAGADVKGRTGQLSREATHLIKVACEVATGQRKYIEVFGTDYNTADGTCVRDFIHVSDLATAHICAYRYLLKQEKPFEVFNCGYGAGYSVQEVLDCFSRLLGARLPQLERGRRPGDVVSVLADSAKMRRRMGWKPHYNQLETIIRTALDWEQQSLRSHVDD